MLALTGFIAGNLLAVVASGFPLLLASRMLMAFGAGLCMPTAIGVSVAVASTERRRAEALVTSGMTVALAELWAGLSLRPSPRPTLAGSAARAWRRPCWYTWSAAGRHGENPTELPVDGRFFGVSPPRNLV